MLRKLAMAAAAAVFAAAAFSCATSNNNAAVEQAARDQCRVPGSPDNAPAYDEACMRQVRENLASVRFYEPPRPEPKQAPSNRSAPSTR